MSDQLKCQMCGHEQALDETPDIEFVDGAIFDICQTCGARILRYPKPKDGLLEEGLIAKLAKRDALIENLNSMVEWLACKVGHYIEANDPDYGNFQAIVAEWKDQK